MRKKAVVVEADDDVLYKDWNFRCHKQRVTFSCDYNKSHKKEGINRPSFLFQK